MAQINLDTLPRSQKEALALGSKLYYTGKPCKRGHIAPRYASAAKCVDCATEESRSRLPQIAAWKAANPERVKAAEANYRERNRPIINERARAWSQKQRDEGSEYSKKQVKLNQEYIRNRLATDPGFKWAARMRSNTHKRLAQHNSQKLLGSLEIYGCTIPELRSHLESQFQPGMTWDNYGLHGWHIDHIIPCASFDLTDPEQQKACFHYTNLQPLWAEENLKKRGQACGLTPEHSRASLTQARSTATAHSERNTPMPIA
jgi:hypothetical protein